MTEIILLLVATVLVNKLCTRAISWFMPVHGRLKQIRDGHRHVTCEHKWSASDMPMAVL